MAPGVGVSWIPGGSLVTASADGPSHEVAAWDPPAPFYKLFFQGHLQFMVRASAVERSRLLRASMIDCARDLEDPQSAHALNLSAALTVWSFMEAVYLIDPAFDSSHVSSRLGDWYAQNYPALLQTAREYLEMDVNPATEQDEDQFWSLVSRLAAVGSRGMAQRLVSARISRAGFGQDWAESAGAAALGIIDDEAATRHSPLSVAEAMLAECPVNADSSFAARSDSSWVRWQDTCDAWADEQDDTQEGRLKVLLKTLAGSVHHMSIACKSWEEMLVATATYARRVLSDTRNDHGIVEVENACAEASAVFQPPHEIAGGALVDAAVGQPAEAIVRLGASLNTTWYAAHLCDLLMQSKQLGPEAASRWMPAPGGVSLLEYLILEFTGNLESNSGMWRIAADYYTQCPLKGRRRLKDMLRRVTSVGAVDPVVEKVVTFCLAHNIGDVVQDVCGRVGAESAHTRNYGGAAYWYARGGLMNDLLNVVDIALEEAEVGGPGSLSAKALSHVVLAATVASKDDAIQERIAFAQAYVQFQDAIALVADDTRTADDMVDGNTDEDERIDAAKRAERLALQLLCGGGLPRRFWPNVIYEVCTLLKKTKIPKGIFDTDTLYELLSALEAICSIERQAESFEGLGRRIDHEAWDSEQARDDSSNQGAAKQNVENALQQMRSLLLEAVTASFASLFA